MPALAEKDRDDLTACAENILLAREAHSPATIAEIHDPEKMPDNLRATHERNDEALERIHIGRQFKNDTERLAKLFDLYTKVTGSEESSPKQRQATRSQAYSKVAVQRSCLAMSAPPA